MRIYEGLADATNAIREWYYTRKAQLSEHVQKKIGDHVGQGNSPVDLAVHFTETIYANRDAEGVDKEGLEIAAGTAAIIHQHGFHSDMNGRATRIQEALRRDSGERAPNGSGGWPEKSKDPAPADGYAAPPAPEADETE